MWYKKIISNKQTPFWLIAFSFLIGFTVPVLIQDGMFMDAMLYTSVAHNLSLGIGTFWFPQFSVYNVAGLPSFHEQPPLVFGIQAIFYRLLGDSMYVERFYTFLTMCTTAFLIAIFWSRIFKNQTLYKKISWLPTLMWITIPVVFWSYSNNMHENTMGIFTLCSVFFTYIAFYSSKKIEIFLLLLSGIFIVLASLSKGIPGFFPIGAPLLYWLTTKKTTFSKAVFQTSTLTAAVILIYICFYFFPDSKESLSTYLFKRALNRISNAPTVDNRFYILGHLFMQLIPQLVIVLFFVILARLKKINLLASEKSKEVLFFISVGLSASAPLMLTLVQKGFYFVPALPFFAIGLSLFISPIISLVIENMNLRVDAQRKFVMITLLLFVTTTTFSFMQKGKYSRDKEMLHDIYAIGSVVPKKSILSVPDELWNDWALQCYFIRYFNISLEINDANKYYMIDKQNKMAVPKKYKQINIATLRYNLYQR